MIHDSNNIPPAADKLVEAIKKAGIEVQGSVVSVVDSGRGEMTVGLQ